MIVSSRFPVVFLILLAVTGALGVSPYDRAPVVTVFGLPVEQPLGVALDSSTGNLYVSFKDTNCIREYAPDGTLVGTIGICGTQGSTDGPVASATFYAPGALCVRGSKVFVADASAHNVRMITNGVVTTLAGEYMQTGTNDGAGTNARFWGPQSVTANADGSVVFVADTDARYNLPTLPRVRKIVVATGTVTTFAVASDLSANCPNPDSGRAIGLQGVAYDVNANILLATCERMIYKMPADGSAAVTLLAGSPTAWDPYDGTGASAGFGEFNAYGNNMVMDSNGNIVASDTGKRQLRVISPAGVTQTLSVDFSNGAPLGIAVSSTGVIFAVQNPPASKLVIVTPPPPPVCGTNMQLVGDAACQAAPGYFFTAATTVASDAGISCAGKPFICPAGTYGASLVLADLTGAVVCDSTRVANAAGSSCDAAPGYFAPSAASTEAATRCPPGFSSSGGGTAATVASCTVRCDTSAPTTCTGVFLFSSATPPLTTGCYYGNAASNLGTNNAWVPATSGTLSAGASVCTKCTTGLVSPGWSTGAASTSACIDSNLTVVSATCDAAAPSNSVSVSFSGGEAQTGGTPTAEDVDDANDAVLTNVVFAGTASCSTAATANGAFVCTGFTADIGYKCSTAGAAPVASLTSSTPTSACLPDGTLKAVFSGGNYPTPTTNQVSSADMGLVNALTSLAAGISAKSDFATGAVSTSVSGTCVVTAANTVTCYGYALSSGYVCPAGASVPVQCGTNMQPLASNPVACEAAPGFYFATAITEGSGSATTCAGNADNFICPAGTFGSSLAALTGMVVCAIGEQPNSGATACAALSASAVVYLASSIALGGYSASTFGTYEALAFCGAVTGAFTTASNCTITSASASAGRHLLQTASVVVSYSLKTTFGDSAALGTTMSAAGGPLSATSIFTAAGMTACTSAAPASAVPVMLTTLPVAASLPVTSAPPPTLNTSAAPVTPSLPTTSAPSPTTSTSPHRRLRLLVVLLCIAGLLV